jgi:endonuclease IV
MRDPRFDNIPMVLETPVSSDLIYTEEMYKLYKMEQQQKKE